MSKNLHERDRISMEQTANPIEMEQRTAIAIENTLAPLKERYGGETTRFKDVKCKLLQIARNCNMFDSRMTVAHILGQRREDTGEPCSKGYIRKILEVYRIFCRDNQVPVDIPKIHYEPPIPLIPSTENLAKIINRASAKYATIFSIMKETGIEGAELHNTHRNMIDAENGIISVKGTKGHSNGKYKLSTATKEMLKLYLDKHQEPYPFPKSKVIGSTWRYHRNLTANKLCEPELKKIPLKNLRNYAGAQFYNTKGKDSIATQRFMRHKRLDTTQHYLQAIKLYEPNMEYTHKTVQLGTKTTIKEIETLCDAGYTEFSTADGYKVFRRLK